MSTATRVDFKAVKAALPIQSVVTHYGFQMKPAKEAELSGRCPFHEDTKPSFRVNTEKNVFNCFGCKAKGNALELIQLKEGGTIRDAAVKAIEWFSIDGAVQESQRSEKKKPANGTPKAEGKRREETKPAENGNRVLTFELKLESDHPYLKGRGVDAKLSQHFGIGYCSRGMMKGRIATPIHNDLGELVAYLGRWANDDVPDKESKYLLPAGFQKNAVLFNWHRVSDQKTLTLVEGVWSVFRLHRLGIPAVALLGRSLSDQQERLLGSGQVKGLTLMLDGDEAGEEAQVELLRRLSEQFWIRAVWLEAGEEPDTLEEERLRKFLRK